MLTHPHRFQLIALAILVAGFALRLALYDYHGLEGDDGFSLALSRQPLDTLIPGLMRLELDIHPPLHFVALKGWTNVTGESLLSLRLLNILADVLTGALVMRLAGRAVGRRGGLTAGVLWTAAPLLLYALLLVRMYSLMALFSTGGAVCALEIVRTRRAVWAVALGLCGLAALYTHITGVIVVGALGLALAAAWALWRDARRALPGLAALGAAGVLYVPFALPLLDVYRSGRTLGAEINTSKFTSALDVPGTVLAVLLAHRDAADNAAQLVIVALFIVASVWLARQGRLAVVLLVVAWAGITGMMALAAGADLYKPRYLAPFVPAALALIAGGIARLSQRGITAALVVLLGISAWGIRADLDRTTRDDWTAAASFVEAHERPDDAVIVIPDWGQEAFAFHYEGAAPVTGVFPRVTADVDITPTLESLIEGHDGVWLVRYQPEVADAERIAERWFQERAVTMTTVFPAGMQVSYYDFAPPRAALPDDARPLDATFGEVVRLRGVYLPVTLTSARDTRLHPPSAWVQVVLYWEVLQPGAAFIPRARFTSPNAEVYGAALEGANHLLARYPVSTWQAGEVWQVGYDLNLNPATPPGVYNIEVMALDPASGQPLTSTGADAGEFWVIAGQVEIMP